MSAGKGLAVVAPRVVHALPFAAAPARLPSLATTLHMPSLLPIDVSPTECCAARSTGICVFASPAAAARAQAAWQGACALGASVAAELVPVPPPPQLQLQQAPQLQVQLPQAHHLRGAQGRRRSLPKPAIVVSSVRGGSMYTEWEACTQALQCRRLAIAKRWMKCTSPDIAPPGCAAGA